MAANRISWPTVSLYLNARATVSQADGRAKPVIGTLCAWCGSTLQRNALLECTLLKRQLSCVLGDNYLDTRRLSFAQGAKSQRYVYKDTCHRFRWF